MRIGSCGALRWERLGFISSSTEEAAGAGGTGGQGGTGRGCAAAPRRRPGAPAAPASRTGAPPAPRTSGRMPPAAPHRAQSKSPPNHSFPWFYERLHELVHPPHTTGLPVAAKSGTPVGRHACKVGRAGADAWWARARTCCRPPWCSHAARAAATSVLPARPQPTVTVGPSAGAAAAAGEDAAALPLPSIASSEGLTLVPPGCFASPAARGRMKYGAVMSALPPVPPPLPESIDQSSGFAAAARNAQVPRVDV